MKDDKTENSFYYDPDFYRPSSLCDDEYEIKKEFANRSTDSPKNRDNSSNDQGER